MAKRLPFHPSTEHLKKQAKQLVKAHQAGDVQALARIQALFPRLAGADARQIIEAEFTLCNAQLVVAREYGFPTWKELVASVENGETAGLGDVFIADAPVLQGLEARLKRLAGADSPVLLRGEDGSGQAQAAMALHRLGPRGRRPFVRLDGRSAVPALIDSELFGHEEGAFTGAVSRRLGKVETARGGTLFIDGVEALPPQTQARLRRLVDDGTFERIGGEESLAADVRLVAGSAADLQASAGAGAFDPDLAYVLGKLVLDLPPLRQRTADTEALARHYAAAMAAELGLESPSFAPAALDALRAHDWPGNLRELEQRVQRAVAEAETAEIGPGELGLG